MSVISASGCASWFAPKAKLRGHSLEAPLQAGQASGQQSFDHSAWADVLRAASHPDRGRFDYSAVPHEALDRYLDQLARADLQQLPVDEQKALLINAYNAFTIKLIAEQPALPASIRDLDDPWGTERWTVGGARVSLNDIEHSLLRPIFRDPRLHFALNCASIGCPPLRDQPYEGPTVDVQLDAATADTLTRPGWLSVDGDRITATALVNWYRPDFSAEGWSPRADSPLQWLANHGPAEVGEAVKAGASLHFAAYDWRINDVRTPVN